MAVHRVIFFDVGNTLLFPNRARILQPLPADRHPTLAQWQALERRTKKEFDQEMLGGRIDHSFWWVFHTHLLEELDALDDNMHAELIKNTQNSANWDQILPGTVEALQRIGRVSAMAVISNSDGGIEDVLRRCGIAQCFRRITDSGVVGQEKPHPAIFQAALRGMQAQPEESLYVGDLYSVDYAGARNAGMEAVLFDVAGTYRNQDLPRVESLEELENWLRQ
jgi:HAD superfamily hydrolase (TIGR01509 family)